MAVDSLRTHLVDELVDLRDAEEQLTKALPKLARSATSKPLRTAFEKHLKETRAHVTRLNQALRDLGETPRSKTCEGMKGLLKEGETAMNKAPEGALRDAVMITGVNGNGGGTNVATNTVMPSLFSSLFFHRSILRSLTKRSSPFSPALRISRSSTKTPTTEPIAEMAT